MSTHYRYTRRGAAIADALSRFRHPLGITVLPEALFPPSGVRGRFQGTWTFPGLLRDLLVGIRAWPRHL
jgi:hypothetical protein